MHAKNNQPPAQRQDDNAISPWVSIIDAVAYVYRTAGCSWELAISRLHHAFIDDEVRSMERHRVAGQWVQNSLTADFWCVWDLYEPPDLPGRVALIRPRRLRHLLPPPIGWHLFVARADLEERWPDETSGKKPSELQQAIMSKLKILENAPEGRALTRKQQADEISKQLGRNYRSDP